MRRSSLKGVACRVEPSIEIELNKYVLARGRKLRETREQDLMSESDELSPIARESMMDSKISSGNAIGEMIVDVSLFTELCGTPDFQNFDLCTCIMSCC